MRLAQRSSEEGRVLGVAEDRPPVDLAGAAGAVEAMATVSVLRERLIPPTLGYEQPDEGLDLDYVPAEARALQNGGRRVVAISNSFGFGGHNAVLCLGSA